MVCFNSRLYADSTVKENPQKYRRMIRQKKRRKNRCYFVTLPANAKNCMDIYRAGAKWLLYYTKGKENRLEIIGVAADKEGLEEILCKMSCDILKSCGSMNAESVRRYFHA